MRRLFLFVLLCTGARPLLAQHLARYVIQLADVTTDDAKAVAAGRLDVVALGGREVENWREFMVVDLPPEAVEKVRLQPAVRRITPVTESAGGGASPPTKTDVVAQPPTWDSGIYKYDGAGNVVAIGNDFYAYDAVQRLTAANVSGVSSTYTYDAFGNRTRAVTHGVPLDTPANTTTNRLNGAQVDEVGNHLTMPGHGETFRYDAANMMVSRAFGNTINERYLYTADDERIATRTSGGIDWTIRDLDGSVLKTYSSSISGGGTWQWMEEYAYRDAQLVTADRLGCSRAYFHLDHLGTPRLMTDDMARQLVVHEYEPFGIEQTPCNQESLSWPGTTTIEDHQFTGHERDFLSNGNCDPGSYLDDMHARYYSPRIGRFVSVDTARSSADVSKPQSWNRYPYAFNNPMLYNDPTGKAPNKAGTADPKLILQEVRQLQARGLSKKEIFLELSERHSGDENRYFFTNKFGWVDIRHFGRAAAEASTKGSVVTEVLGTANEVMQWATEWGDDYRSGFHRKINRATEQEPSSATITSARKAALKVF